MHYTTCEMDACNTKFLMKFKDTLIGTITKIINVSLTTGQYLDEWKIAVVRPLIKGPNLDTEYQNYCPISNLSFMSKLIEKAAQTQLMTHFTEHNLLPNIRMPIEKTSQLRLLFSISVTTSGPAWRIINLLPSYAWISVWLLTL